MPQYQPNPMAMMYGSNKSQKCYNNSSNRKKQQHLINSLKSWNLQITPSGLDKPDDELSTVTSATSQKKELDRPFASKSTVPAKSVQDNTVPSVGEYNNSSTKKKVQELKSNRCKVEEMKEHALMRLTTLKIDRDIAMKPKEQSKNKNNNTSPNQYKFEFLRDVGLKMSLTGNVVGGANNTSAGDISMYRGSSQANYNFTQQFQQHMMQQQQTNQLQQQHHSSSHQSPHQPHQLLQLHRLMPQHPQYGRSQNVYGSDELSAQHCALSDPQSFSNFALLNAVEGHSSIHVGKNIELSYLYSQAGGGVHAQHQAVHYKQPLLDQQPQHPAQMQNYHQNNNYQYHNRNGNGQGGNQLNYSSQGATRLIGTVSGREDGGRNGANGKKFWNAHGKGRNNSYQANNGSKQVSKMQSAGYGYRKNYQHYYNHPASGANHYYEHIAIQQQQQHQPQAQTHHHHKPQHLHRNLVYVRGYDRGHGAVSSHEYTSGNQHQKVVQTELTHSAPSSPPNGKSAVEDTTNRSESAEKNGDNGANTIESEASSDAQHALLYDGYRGEECGAEKVKTSELHEEPYPPLKEFVPSAPSSLHASTIGLVDEFIVRSQSFHGSHQNLTAYGNGGGNVGGDSPPVGSPNTIPRAVTGTQSVPVFGDLFSNTNQGQPNPIQFIHSQSAGNFGSNASLDLALHSATTNSSSSSSLSVSSVPPNDFQSMQSGHPKTR
uniref:Uncharacterized protein n=1 Tax=Anopheles maculatus TaxID=74869 RepID=A0A182SCA9_9DIPT